MSLKEEMKGDVVVHMKAGNKIALTTVRNVVGEIETPKYGKTRVKFDDLQVIGLLPKENGQAPGHRPYLGGRRPQ